MRALLIASLATIAACGGSDGKKPPEKPVAKPRPVAAKPPPPPPVCIKGGDAMGAIGGATGDDAGAAFCVSDGTSNECFAVDLASGKYEKRDEPPTPQPATIEASDVKVETTAAEIKVCKGEDCKTVTPKVPKTDNQLTAVASATLAVVMVGDAEAGKGVAELWDVGKNKKTATIKYAKGDFKCGVPKLLGDTIYISASVCAGPAARGALYTAKKGKKLADVGGKDFGTYSEVAVQVKDNLWAFLEENGSMIALQDVATGKVAKTIPLAALWAPAALPSGDDQAEPGAVSMGNPGESALVRGGDNQLLVIAGSPATGTVGVVDLATGDVKLVRAPTCAE